VSRGHRGADGATMRSVARMWTYAVSDGVPKRALIVAAVIGSILNAINQGDALLLHPASVNLTKLILTFIVPYLVSTYGAVSYRMHAEAGASRVTGR
jgi:hypothetical protein